MLRVQVCAAAIVASLVSCAAPPSPEPTTDDVLYVWSWDTDQKSTDFLAVVDVDVDSSSYGTLLDTVPVDLVGGAHHTEHRMPDGGTFFANAFAAGTTFAFDVSLPSAPHVSSSFQGRGPYTFPHSFERLPNGNVLVTFQNRGDGNVEPGGLAELDAGGNYVRGADAADRDVVPDIRPYSLAILPELDRVVTTTADMRGQLQGRSVQIWQLSELRLLKTLVLPGGDRGDENVWPAEPRVLSDGRTVLVNTFSCGLYRLVGLDTDEPQATYLRNFPYEPPHRCALGIRTGEFWVQTVPTSESLVALDISDSARPQIVDELKLGDGYRPHWIAPDSDGDRIVATGRGEMVHRVVLVRFDTKTGQLALDPQFGELSFERESWPHGDTGTATPHGAIFSR